jgi:U3 small nucleolar ribonucleoprotein protein IMP4
VEAANTNGFTDLIVLHENRGEPDGFVVSHLPYGPTAYFTIFNSVMRHETNVETSISEAYPHLSKKFTKIHKKFSTISKPNWEKELPPF